MNRTVKSAMVVAFGWLPFTAIAGEMPQQQQQQQQVQVPVQQQQAPVHKVGEDDIKKSVGIVVQVPKDDEGKEIPAQAQVRLHQGAVQAETPDDVELAWHEGVELSETEMLRPRYRRGYYGNRYAAGVLTGAILGAAARPYYYGNYGYYRYGRPIIYPTYGYNTYYYPYRGYYPY